MEAGRGRGGGGEAGDVHRALILCQREERWDGGQSFVIALYRFTCVTV